MFKNALIYRIRQWQQPSAAELQDRLATSRFVECGATQMESAGFVEPRGEKHAALVETIGGQLILRLCDERKAVPASVIKTELEARLDKLVADTGGRRTLDIGQVGEHIHEGNLATRLALSWAGRVSFVLTEAMTLKKIKLLDVVLEGQGNGRDDGGFDADVAISTGELKLMIPDLIAALGGELDRDGAAGKAVEIEEAVAA